MRHPPISYNIQTTGKQQQRLRQSVLVNIVPETALKNKTKLENGYQIKHTLLCHSVTHSFVTGPSAVCVLSTAEKGVQLTFNIPQTGLNN